MPPDFQSIATRHGFSAEAVLVAWNAFRNSGGIMAQFNHPDLGGAGQWMPSMLMIGDMFNHGLKARVDQLFRDLASLPGSSSPSQGDGASLSYEHRSATADIWYPPELGLPATSGAQNNLRYAYFPGPRRLAIELGGKLTLYDTGPHIISGVSQAQRDAAGSITFISQLGVIPLSALPVISLP
jgi:hypothetical protein